MAGIAPNDELDRFSRPRVQTRFNALEQTRSLQQVREKSAFEKRVWVENRAARVQERAKQAIVVERASRFQRKGVVDEVIGAELQKNDVRIDGVDDILENHQLLKRAESGAAVAEHLDIQGGGKKRSVSLVRRDVGCLGHRVADNEQFSPG